MPDDIRPGRGALTETEGPDFEALKGAPTKHVFDLRVAVVHEENEAVARGLNANSGALCEVLPEVCGDIARQWAAAGLDVMAGRGRLEGRVRLSVSCEIASTAGRADPSELGDDDGREPIDGGAADVVSAAVDDAPELPGGTLAIAQRSVEPSGVGWSDVAGKHVRHAVTVEVDLLQPPDDDFARFLHKGTAEFVAAATRAVRALAGQWVSDAAAKMALSGSKGTPGARAICHVHATNAIGPVPAEVYEARVAEADRGIASREASKAKAEGRLQ